MLKFSVRLIPALALLSGCAHSVSAPNASSAPLPEEARFTSVHPVTAGGDNAEAYWSFDGSRLSFQHRGKWRAGTDLSAPECDQIYSMNADGSGLRQVSDGKGRTTCSFYSPDGNRVYFSTTEAAGPACPAAPDHSHGYVWPVYPSYQIASVRASGGDSFGAEPGAPTAYNAETTFCHDGSVVFTSDRDGDLDLYRATLDSMGTFNDVHRVTDLPGYDGGAFFSPDCKQLVWRASRPMAGAEMNAYRALLREHLVKPSKMELWIGDANGKHARQLTRLGGASFAPSFAPDGKHVIFSSNFKDPEHRRFELYLIDTNGTHLEQVTHAGGFDCFPMFSPDGKHLAFSSRRLGADATNVFIADWNPRATGKLEPQSPADRYQALVEKLSTPEMEGRGVGTAGLARAEALVADEFKRVGLSPYLSKESYFQDVRVGKKGILAHNVVGSLGACSAVRPVIIGAHLDHLGYGDENSLEPVKGKIHPGADDNASGVAAIVEAARIIRADAKLRRRCFVFAAFTGEEIGIVGSSRLAEELERRKMHPMAKAMLNLDMVGRLEKNALLVYGSDSAPEWKKIVETECGARSLSCTGGGDGYGPSDHMAFYIHHVPVLHFFTGPHLDYHRASDTADKINATGGVQVAEVVAAIAERASAPGQPLHYQRAKASPAMGNLVSDPVARNANPNRAYLGTIPDYSTLSSPHGPGGGGEPDGGVKLSGTRPGSPADRAGVKEGDVLIAIGDKRIATLEDFTRVLVALKPGDPVMLTIRRNGQDLLLPATVGKRE